MGAMVTTAVADAPTHHVDPDEGRPIVPCHCEGRHLLADASTGDESFDDYGDDSPRRRLTATTQPSAERSAPQEIVLTSQ